MGILNLTQPTQEVGPDLQNDVAVSLNRLYSQKMTKASLDQMKEKYKIPSNCRGMSVPKVNGEIWPLLPQRIRQNDYNQQMQQHNIFLVSVIMAKVSEKIFTTSEQYAIQYYFFLKQRSFEYLKIPYLIESLNKFEKSF